MISGGSPRCLTSRTEGDDLRTCPREAGPQEECLRRRQAEPRKMTLRPQGRLDVTEFRPRARRDGRRGVRWNGVRIIKGLRDADHGLRGFVFADPDGNRIDVGQQLPPGPG